MSYVSRIDESTCIAQGDCVELAPEIFRLDDHAVVIGAGSDEVLLAAAEGCPVEAIAIVDEETGEQVYP